MSEIEVDAREYVPVDRWRREGQIDAIRKRVRRLAVGAGVVFLTLTLTPSDGELSLLVGAVRLLSLVTGISAWSMTEALGDADSDGDGSILAAVGVIVLVGLSWGAERSAAGALLRRLVLGEVASAAGAEVNATSTAQVITDEDSTATVADRDASAGSRPVGAYLGLVTILLVGGSVVLLALPQAGGVTPGSLGVFLLLVAVVGGVVGLFAGLSIR